MSVTDEGQTDGRKSLCLILNSPITEFCETCLEKFQVSHVLDNVQYKTEPSAGCVGTFVAATDSPKGGY